MSRIHVIHENDDWTAPLLAELDALGLPYEDWSMVRGSLALDDIPPEGVFYNRMSASSHTRGHRYSPEYTAGVLAWLESHGRRVLNPGRALQLEINKTAQYAALKAHGIRTPRTVAALDREALLTAAQSFDGPFITKHNRAGKGFGVKLSQSHDELEAYVDSPAFKPSVDGITLIQDYIEALQPYITRVEFIGRKFLYAVRVDTSQGFELCPADVCNLDSAQQRFTILENFHHSLVNRYQRFMENHGLDVAAFEFIVDKQGRDFTYDINTNTNYNREAEACVGVSGMARLARYLGDELARQQTPETLLPIAVG